MASSAVLLALLVAAPAAGEGSGSFVRYQPLTMSELYAKRMRFAEREPWISVGLMDGQLSVSVGATGPLRLMFDEVDLPKTVYAPVEQKFVLKRISGTPAMVRHWVIVHVGPPSDRAAIDAEADRWRERGRETKVFEAGTILALRGNVLDTREWQVGIGGFAEPAEARALLRELAGEGREQLFLHEELITAPSGVIGVFDARGVLLHRARDLVYVGTTSGDRVKVDAVEFGRGYKFHSREDRDYWGHVYVVVDGAGKLAVVNSIGAEELLAGLVPAEIFATAPLEALKAQAVTARGEIFSKLAHRHYADPFHLCSEQHCQVYKGAKEQQPATDRAVAATRGQLAFRPRKDEGEPLMLVDSVYSSSCGGHSESNEVVWGTKPSPSTRARLDALGKDPALAPFRRGLDEKSLRAFLSAYPPVACSRSTFVEPTKFRWKRTFDAQDLEAIIAPLGIGRLKSARVLGRGPGGRITGLELTGTAGKTEVLRELPVRRLFRNLNSGLFVLDSKRNAAGELEELTFTGGGWGHGVGMCQHGAIGRAQAGQSFEEILGHYYGGAVVQALY